MKRSLLLLILALPAVSGCDFFRSLAGRPTSDEIEAKRQYILRIEEEHRARLDSLRQEEARLSDSLSTADAIRKGSASIISAGSIDGTAAAALEHTYYVMVGTFSRQENAEAIARKAVARGYEATLIKYRNGFTAVGLSGSDNLPEAYKSLCKIREEQFCPPDAWILSNE